MREARLGQVRPPAIADAGLDTRTIVIVDDHPVFRRMLFTALNTTSDLQCVATASTAAEGEALTERWRPDIVIMDIQMPGQDGLATTRRIRESSPDTMVAVVSAHGEREWIAKAAEAGASAFIAKNGSLPDMVDQLRRLSSTDSVRVPGADECHTGTASDRPAAGAPLLSDIERQALQSLGRGLRGRGLAKELGLGLLAAHRVTRSLRRKLDAADNRATVARGRELGLLAS